MKILNYSLSFLAATLVTATLAQARSFETVYGRKADVSALEKVIMMKDLRQVVSEMEKSGVRIFRVLEDPQNIKKNPKYYKDKKKYFDFLPTIPSNLQSKLAGQAADTQDEAAIFTSWNDIGREEDGNILLVAEYALPTTLFHEFSHHLFEVANRQDTLKITEEQNQYNATLSVFNFRMGKVLFDRGLLANPIWRRDIDNTIQDSLVFADSVQARGASEEIAVESGLLEMMWEMHSPWFNYDRAHEGIYIYGQGLVNTSKQRMQAVLGLMDMVRTDGENMDPDVTMEEIQKREKIYLPIRQRLEKYITEDITLMQSAVDKAKAYLEQVKQSLGRGK